MHTIKTRLGQRVRLRFSDGVILFLNSSTTLQFTEKLKRGMRSVSFEGEMYAEIPYIRKGLFVVRTNGVTTQTTGGGFNVCSWPGEKRVEVVATRGIVAAYPNTDDRTDGLTIRHGERLVIERNTYAAPPEMVDLDQYLAWLDGRLVFDNTPMAAVARVLGRRFDVRCVVDQSIASRTLTVNFRPESLDEILGSVRRMLDIAVEQSEAGIRFSVRPHVRTARQVTGS